MSARETSRQLYRKYRDEVKKRPPDRSYSPHSFGQPNAVALPAKPKEKQRKFWPLLKEFWGLLEGYRSKIVLALVALTASTLLSLVPPAGTKWAIDYALTSPPQKLPQGSAEWLATVGLSESPGSLLVAISAVVIGVTLIRTLIHLWGRWIATKVVNQVQATLRRRVLGHLLDLPLHRVVQLKSGGATSILREDAGGVADLIFSMLYNPWQAIVQLVGSFVVLIFVDWRLMLGGMILLPAVYFSHRTWIHRIRPLYRDIRNQRQKIDAATTETFGGVRVVRTFARQRSEENRFVRSSHLLVRQQLFVWWTTRLIEIVWEVLIPLSSTLLLVYGGWQIMQGRLTLGDLMMFLVYLAMLLGPIATIAGTAVQLQNNLAGLDRILDLLAEPSELPDVPNAKRLVKHQVAGELILENISFRYPETERMVLQNISLHIKQGTTVALVGRSGAGKTTLCNLIARFYDPTEGSISLDGIKLTDIQLSSFRSLLGMVEQDVFLFDGTIAENIGYGRRGATEEEIRQAARFAAAEQFIEELPQKFETLIGERGVKLSGGQRQRLAIARAILADPRILILDEATSNLDSENEQLIQQSLQHLMKGRTSIVIAHRLSTIQHADQIVVLDDGSVLERGTHQQLMESSGRYRKMIELQMNQRLIDELGG